MSIEVHDAVRAETFAGRMLGIVNDGMLSLMVSVGHRTGLFDVMAGLEWATTEAIATAAGLQERYVREWLGAMTTGRIVEFDPAAATYRLPFEHALCVTRAAGAGNVASFAQFVAMLGRVEGAVVGAFRDGGGVPYGEFPEFTRLMAEESGQVFDAALLSTVLPLVPELPSLLQTGIDVADIGCGSGRAVNLMASAYPCSRFVGIDFSTDAVAAARSEALRLGLANVTFDERDVAAMDVASTFDLVTSFDAIHDQAHPDRVLRNIFEMLRPGGCYLCVDIRASSDVGENVDHPFGPYLYTVSCMHCMTVSLAQGGAGLGAVWGEQKAVEMIMHAGFTDVRVATVPDDMINNYYVARRP